MGYSCSTLVKRIFSPVMGFGELVAGALLPLGALEEGLSEHGRGVVLVGVGDCAGIPSPGVRRSTLPQAPPSISRWFQGSLGM